MIPIISGYHLTFIGVLWLVATCTTSVRSNLMVLFGQNTHYSVRVGVCVVW